MKTSAIDPKLMTRDLTRAWGVVARHLPVPIFDDKSYDRAVKAMNVLVDHVGDDEDHALAGLLDMLGGYIADYDEEHHRIEASPPHETLAFLMQQQGLKQTDLADLVDQGTLSKILRGNRAISKTLAKALAARFKVSVQTFL